jgi:hypothetical protein
MESETLEIIADAAEEAYGKTYSEKSGQVKATRSPSYVTGKG